MNFYPDLKESKRGGHMEMLNANSLAGIMQRCQSYPRYKAIVAFNNASRLQEFISDIRANIREENLDGINGMTRAGIIKFKNGSYIRPILADTKAKGLQANEVIIDESVDNISELKTKIRQLFYHCDEESQEEERVTLDDFLSQFKIVE